MARFVPRKAAAGDGLGASADTAILLDEFGHGVPFRVAAAAGRHENERNKSAGRESPTHVRDYTWQSRYPTGPSRSAVG